MNTDKKQKWTAHKQSGRKTRTASILLAKFSWRATTRSCVLAGDVLLERAQEGVLLGGCLEDTVPELGGGINPLELDLLGSTAADLRVESLAQSENTLLDTWDTALDKDEVVLNFTVVREATHADLRRLLLAHFVKQYPRVYGPELGLG